MNSEASVTEIYEALTPGSKALAEQAIRIFPSGITHDSRYQKPYGLYVDRAKGSRKWDVDGNEYVDYVGGHGGHLLGHGNEAVVEAVQRSVSRGTQLGANTPDEIEYGNLVKEMVPCAERVRFTMSGTESTHLALRLARAYTGKSTTIRFMAHFHGWHDAVASGYSSHFAGGVVRGVQQSHANDTILLPPGDIDAVRTALNSCDDVAAIILEPTGTHFGLVPFKPEYLSQLRDITSQRNVVLIFDEVITGFRVAPGGAQEALGVIPDLSTHAKIIAGGLPGGAVCGRKVILDMLDFDVMEAKGEEKVQHNGTFNANLVSAQAGIAMLKQIRDTDACERANAYGEKLRRGMNEVLVAQRMPWAVYGEFSGFFIFTNPTGLKMSPLDFNPLDYDFTVLKTSRLGFARTLVLALIIKGIHIAGFPGGWVSSVHSDDDYQKTVSGFEDAVVLLKREQQ
jgi:glutamate-1-semialdehyde 2,1-aminomutase